MAVYSTFQAFEAAVGQARLLKIADPQETGVVDYQKVVTALAEASSIMDSYLTTYLPLAQPYAPVYTRACHVIAEHNLRTSTDSTTEDSRRAFDEVMKWLALIAKGDVTPVDPPVSEAADPGDPEIISNARVWTRGAGLRVF